MPRYVIYKAKHLYSGGIEGGPKKTRYNGEKILIGDYLSAHLFAEAIPLCQERNIKCLFLPGISTYLTQPLDIAFFRPLKGA